MSAIIGTMGGVKKQAVLYYDIISPYSYFYISQRHRLEQWMDIHPVPVLLGGLLRAAENRGPGEITAKRPHTYQHCVWLAEKLGLPFRFPEHHPFLTVAAQRLLTQESADWVMIEKAFKYVWVEGKDPNLSWEQFCEYLGLESTTPKPEDPEIKTQLVNNTEKARLDGAFGVPALVLNGHCFWGLDTMDWVLDYAKRPSMFEEPSYLHASNVPRGI